MSSPHKAPPDRPPSHPTRRGQIPNKSDRGLTDKKRISICQQLLKGVEVKHIATYEKCSRAAVYNVRRNLMEYGSVRAPPRQKLGARTKISEENADALYNKIIENGWMSQSRICRWLRSEQGITISTSSVSRFFEDKGWTERSLRPFIKKQPEKQLPQEEEEEEDEDGGAYEDEDAYEYEEGHGDQQLAPPQQARPEQVQPQYQGDFQYHRTQQLQERQIQTHGHCRCGFSHPNSIGCW